MEEAKGLHPVPRVLVLLPGIHMHIPWIGEDHSLHPAAEEDSMAGVLWFRAIAAERECLWMMGQTAILVVLGVVSAVVGGMIGRRRCNTVVGALYGLLLGPFGWWIVASAWPQGRP